MLFNLGSDILVRPPFRTLQIVKSVLTLELNQRLNPRCLPNPRRDAPSYR